MTADFKGQLEKQIKNLLLKSPTKENIESVYHMLKLGADPLTANDHQYHVLKYVITFGDLPTFLKFVNEFKYDLELSHVDTYNTPFDYAVNYLALDIIKWFLDSKKLLPQKIQSALPRFCTFHFPPELEEKAVQVIKLFIENGANLVTGMYEQATLVNGSKGPFMKFLSAEMQQAQAKLLPVSTPVSTQEKCLQKLEEEIKKKDFEIKFLGNQNEGLLQEIKERDEKILLMHTDKEKLKIEIERLGKLVSEKDKEISIGTNAKVNLIIEVQSFLAKLIRNDS